MRETTAAAEDSREAARAARLASSTGSLAALDWIMPRSMFSVSEMCSRHSAMDQRSGADLKLY
jgi:hypothetical protein